MFSNNLLKKDQYFVYVRKGLRNLDLDELWERIYRTEIEGMVQVQALLSND